LVGYTSDPEHASNSIQWNDEGVSRSYQGVGLHNGFGAGDVVKGLSGEAVHIMKDVDEAEVRADLQKLYDNGYRSVAVVLAHS
jgi:5-oxoprolinase (ATP-hydrolysing)